MQASTIDAPGRGGFGGESANRIGNCSGCGSGGVVLRWGGGGRDIVSGPGFNGKGCASPACWGSELLPLNRCE